MRPERNRAVTKGQVREKKGMYLGNKDGGTAGSLDLFDRGLREETGLDDHGLVGQITLGQHLVVSLFIFS